VKTIFIQARLILRLTFNPGLALTAFRTTRPRCRGCYSKHYLSIQDLYPTHQTAHDFLCAGQFTKHRLCPLHFSKNDLYSLVSFSIWKLACQEWSILGMEFIDYYAQAWNEIQNSVQCTTTIMEKKLHIAREKTDYFFIYKSGRSW